ncbi:protein BEAN1-like, partial [Scleropages formosus]
LLPQNTLVTRSNRVQTEADRNGPKACVRVALLHHREVLKLGYCTCNRLKCPCKTDCGRKYMLMKVICAGFHVPGASPSTVQHGSALTPPVPREHRFLCLHPQASCVRTLLPPGPGQDPPPIQGPERDDAVHQCIFSACKRFPISQGQDRSRHGGDYTVESEPAHEYPDCREGSGAASLLVSPLVVAGIVIGLVLFLSCVTIIVGSLRKDGRLRSHHLHAREASDGLSYGGSVGELRSPCVEEFAPAFDFSFYTESPTRTGLVYPDSPPHYEECVGPGATEIYVPTDDPPPYSLADPCLEAFRPANPTTSEAQERWNGASYLAGTPVSYIGLPVEDAPPYEAVVSGPRRPIPLMPTEPLKHPGEESELRGAVSHRTV